MHIARSPTRFNSWATYIHVNQIIPAVTAGGDIPPMCTPFKRNAELTQHSLSFLWLTHSEAGCELLSQSTWTTEMLLLLHVPTLPAYVK